MQDNVAYEVCEIISSDLTCREFHSVNRREHSSPLPAGTNFTGPEARNFREGNERNSGNDEYTNEDDATYY